MNSISINFQDFVQIHNNQAVTTSEFIAKAFGKAHKNVLAKIDELLTQVPDSFGKLNFKPTEKVSKQTFGERKERAYELTKDGFMLLVMGFTGKAAMSIKIAYIEAFNAMAAALQNPLSTTQGKDIGEILGDCFTKDREARAVAVQHHADNENISRESFELLAKMVSYANEYCKIQKMICTTPDSPEAKQYLCSTSPNQTGFLYVFKSNIENDVKQAFNWLHQQSQYLDM